MNILLGIESLLLMTDEAYQNEALDETFQDTRLNDSHLR